MIAAILTSAGESSRMGTPKPVIKWPDVNFGRNFKLQLSSPVMFRIQPNVYYHSSLSLLLYIKNIYF